MSGASSHADAPRVAVVGGGLAGLAAAVALCERGFAVELFEARRRLGGRAGSFFDRRLGQMIDHGQHVALGCCTHLADFCRRAGLAECFAHQSQLHFIGPQGKRYDLSAASFLPAPLHLVPGLMRLGFLSLADRLRILGTMGRLARSPMADNENAATVHEWLRRQGESDRAVAGFWSVILVSALGETLDRISVPAARKVLVDGFLASPGACELLVPKVPLDEIFNQRLAAWLENRGAAVHLGTPVRRIQGDGRRASALVMPDGSRRPFDFFVVAVPWQRVRTLFETMPQMLPALEGAGRIESSPITGVHLWLDRPIMRLPNAVLVGRLGQWIFSRVRQTAGADRPPLGAAERQLPDFSNHPHRPRAGYYYQVVISASRELKGRGREEVVAQVTSELAAIWPAAARARLLHWRMITSPEAVFSVRPGLDRFRPSQRTPVGNLALAGDWTATGWPATMEGAVRSGYLAAEAILSEAGPGNDRRLVVPDLPRGRLARWLIGAAAPA